MLSDEELAAMRPSTVGAREAFDLTRARVACSLSLNAYLAGALAVLGPTVEAEPPRASSARAVGALYRRTRLDETGAKAQRAEVRFDGVAGCLRTPAGGSSRQSLLIVERGDLRSRLLTAREAARLMGLPDSYVLPKSANEALHLVGDGVVAPVVRFLAQNLLEPLLAAPEAVPGQARRA